MELAGVPDDTDLVTHRVQIAGLRAMTPEQRLEMTFALCASASELTAAGLRLRHGDLPPDEMRRRLAVLRLGEELVQRVDEHRARLNAKR